MRTKEEILKALEKIEAGPAPPRVDGWKPKPRAVAQSTEAVGQRVVVSAEMDDVAAQFREALLGGRVTVEAEGNLYNGRVTNAVVRMRWCRPEPAPEGPRVVSSYDPFETRRIFGDDE